MAAWSTFSIKSFGSGSFLNALMLFLPSMAENTSMITPQLLKK
jgi:hypothetical protein